MKPTKEQILAEPAGRQMDAWVAEYVMGFRWYQCVGGSIGQIFRLYLLPPDWLAGDWFTKTTFRDENMRAEGWECTIPRYSIDIAAAWQVVNRRARNRGKGLFPLQLVQWDVSWNATFTAPGEDEGGFSWYELEEFGGYPFCARADTAPLAICRAALLVACECEPDL